MKSAPDQNAIESAIAATASANHSTGKFQGTDNPRHLRAIALLMERPAKRSEIDDRAGCANGPELIAELKRRGLNIECERIKCLDRDGYPCRPGIYQLTPTGRRKVMQWMATRGRA
jgi:hypothetical protein